MSASEEYRRALIAAGSEVASFANSGPGAATAKAVDREFRAAKAYDVEVESLERELVTARDKLERAEARLAAVKAKPRPRDRGDAWGLGKETSKASREVAAARARAKHVEETIVAAREQQRLATPS
jgi:predicted  nucleic acid-binding Zn-ribbon protein